MPWGSKKSLFLVMVRCKWAKNELDKVYHDQEWGVPLHNDQRLFEFLILEGAQAGLSWSTILAKREGYRKAFDQFDAKLMAQYTPYDLEKLKENPGIIRNRLKIKAAVTNAKAFLKVVEEFGSFSEYIWRFVNHKPIINYWEDAGDVPNTTSISEDMSKSLKKRGFTFVGPTICYAFMQATGMVNDHTVDCFRHKELVNNI